MLGAEDAAPRFDGLDTNATGKFDGGGADTEAANDNAPDLGGPMKDDDPYEPESSRWRRATITISLLYLAALVPDVIRDATVARHDLGHWLMYVDTALLTVAVAREIVATWRHGVYDDRALAARWLGDVFWTASWAIALIFGHPHGVTKSLDIALLAFGLYSLLGSDGRGRRDAVARLIGEKSRARVARLAGAMAGTR